MYYGGSQQTGGILNIVYDEKNVFRQRDGWLRYLTTADQVGEDTKL